MQAIIFSAGLGTRLKPITDTLPKALVPVAGKPLLQWNIEKLISAGCTKIVVNVHHFPEMIRNFLTENSNFGIEIHISDETDAILDTGGGLLKAAPYFINNEPVVAHNVDVMSNLDIKELLRVHKKNNAMATLVVRDRQTQRYLLFDDDMLLAGWKNMATGEIRQARKFSVEKLKPLAFSGIQILSPEIFPLITQTGKFTIIETYLGLAKSNRIAGFEDRSELWMDLGKIEQLNEAAIQIIHYNQSNSNTFTS
jgi:NDP-sugar pyrophosphorylase family protein